MNYLMIDEINTVISRIIKSELNYAKSPWSVELESYVIPGDRNFNDSRIIVKAISYIDFERNRLRYGTRVEQSEVINKVRELVSGLCPRKAVTYPAVRRQIPPLRVATLTLAQVRKQASSIKQRTGNIK